MSPSVTCMLVWVGWLVVILAAGTEKAVNTVYGKLGDEVDLVPASETGIITSITWKDNPNIAILWDGTDMTKYRHFKVRGRLNTSNGVMTITALTHHDNKMYTPEINNVVGTPIRLIVISPVPSPSVIASCDKEKITCNLTCAANTSGAEPVTYRWGSDDKEMSVSSDNWLVIVKENDSNMTEVSCELQNPISQESSEHIANPLISTTPAVVGDLKIYSGLIVFICLLSAVLLLVVFHRFKAGMWFFEKASMPWQPGFWKKDERQPTESNGAAGPSHKGQQEEEYEML
ncbi:lymphocyte function-associated antigen 3-like [Embiotoca jacksoni]|uniref:lymphocyte function-associated antigen 3-like n=1 Tax=Embiotoca jacksoni TaxID=100190 RepID=UPI0037047FA6